MDFILADAYLPAVLNCPPMTDAAFARLCAEQPDLQLELSSDGELIYPSGWDCGPMKTAVAW